MLCCLAIITDLTHILANINNITESFLSLVLESNTNFMFNSKLCDRQLSVNKISAWFCNK